jgi:hypothetical protein
MRNNQSGMKLDKEIRVQVRGDGIRGLVKKRIKKQSEE